MAMRTAVVRVPHARVITWIHAGSVWVLRSVQLFIPTAKGYKSLPNSKAELQNNTVTVALS
jgi:hypothetical protein